MQNQGPIAPRVMFQSFLVVAVNYATTMILFLASLWLLASLFFPEQLKLLNDNEELQEVMANSPTDFFTRPFYWSLLVVNILLNFGLGYLVSRLAPFAGLVHAGILAGVLFVTYLQQSREQHPDIQWMFTLMMLVIPAAVVLGGSLYKPAQDASDQNVSIDV